MSPSGARTAKPSDPWVPARVASSGQKPKRPARNVERRLRSPSDRHKAVQFSAASAFSRGARWVHRPNRPAGPVARAVCRYAHGCAGTPSALIYNDQQPSTMTRKIFCCRQLASIQNAMVELFPDAKWLERRLTGYLFKRNSALMSRAAELLVDQPVVESR